MKSVWGAAFRACGAGCLVAALAVAPLGAGLKAAGSELSDEPIPMATEDDLPARTPPLIEIGPNFLGTGNLPEGYELPTGAVWNPALWVFGSFRTALSHFDDGRNPERTEWANRLDLFANLRLTGTERLVFGISPLHDEADFTGYTFEPDSADGFDDAFNADVTRLFFEGEFVEIFPNLDPDDRKALDIGFAVGRQPLFFQEGMMIDDTVDALGLTRDTVIIPGLSVDTRFTALWGWNEVNRDDNDEDDRAHLFGLFTEGDWGMSTVQFDGAFVAGREDSLHLGASSVQRMVAFGKTINTAFRANASWALEDETADVRDGALLFTELSMTPTGTNNLLYLDGFWAIDSFSSAARDDTAGGPLGRTGILFAAVGLGQYGSALSNQADDSVGSALGYQMFFNNERTQVIFEAGGRLGTDSGVRNEGALGARIQQALGNRFVVRADGFVSEQERGGTGLGVRTEFLTRF